MGQLWIISVKGAVPHSACYFDYANGKDQDGWLGFGPAKHRSPGWPRATPGKVFTDDETHRINHGVIFTVPDARLLGASKEVAAEYGAKSYRVGVVDCVSFSAEVARRCGLGVPLVNMTPFGLIEVLAFWNPYVRKW
jgi:hypothetical protein